MLSFQSYWNEIEKMRTKSYRCNAATCSESVRREVARRIHNADHGRDAVNCIDRDHFDRRRRSARRGDALLLRAEHRTHRRAELELKMCVIARDRYEGAVIETGEVFEAFRSSVDDCAAIRVRVHVAQRLELASVVDEESYENCHADKHDVAREHFKKC